MTRLAPLTAIATLLAAGCAHSPPTRTLTLDAAPPAPSAVRVSYRGPPISVPAVHMPAVSDRVEFVRQASAGQVMVDDFARWGAPLGILARDTLIRDLVARLPAGSVLPPGTAAGVPGSRPVGVTILYLGPDPAGLRMDVAYRIGTKGVLQQATLSEPGDPADAVASAQAFGRLIGQLADRIAAGLPG